MSKSIPLNPNVLRWARITAGYSIDNVVLKINRKRITSDVLKAWEEGNESPSYPLLELLAYKIYKRPLALFFFPEPPDENTPQQSFRTLPEIEIDSMTPRMRYLIRQAMVMQANLADLNDNVNPAPQQILKDLKFGVDSSVHMMASKVREYLKVDLPTQISWKGTVSAFKKWRNILEKNGVYIFKEAFKEDAFSGFCLYDDIFPIIYVNNSMPHTRQIFTLFHELAHLLNHTGGIDKRFDDYITHLTGNKRKVEILCNQFAAEFLVPDKDFEIHTEGIHLTNNAIEQLAGNYGVSREVILRRFLDKQKITQDYYNNMVERWARETPTKSGKGGNFYFNKGAYLGNNYLELAFSRFYQRKISSEQLANYLGVKPKNIPGMEMLLFKRGTDA